MIFRSDRNPDGKILSIHRETVVIRCGGPHSPSETDMLVSPSILLARDKLVFLLYPLLPCRAAHVL